MSSTSIRVPLPPSIPAAFFVPLDGPVEDPLALIFESVQAHVPAPRQPMLLDLLNMGFAQIQCRPTSELPKLPLDLFTALGADPRHVSFVENAKYALLIFLAGEPGWPPVGDMVGGAAAGAVAAQLGKVVVELRIPALLTADEAIARVPDDGVPLPFSSLLQVFVSGSTGGLWITTKGMFRVGLPELQAIDVTPQVSSPMTKAITGLGWKLVKMMMGGSGDGEKSAAAGGNKLGDHFDISYPVEVTADDIIEAYCGQVSAIGGPINFYLTSRMDPDEESEPFLTIEPPEHDLRSPGEYFYEMCAEMFGTDTTTTEAAFDEKMEEAMSIAIEALPDIRNRFIQRRLPAGAQLLVKFAVTDGKNVEYLWAYVTGWESPSKVECYCGNNSRYDKNLRAGQAMTIPRENIVDWLVSVNEEVVEGGWTNKALGH